MKTTLNIHTKDGRIRMSKARKNSKWIKIEVEVDNYGFQTEIPLEQLGELFK